MPISKKNCILDGAQTEVGVFFYYLDTQPFHKGISRNVWEDYGGHPNGLNHSSPIAYWPHPNNFPSWKLWDTRHVCNHFVDPTTSKKISPMQHINHRRLFKRTNYGGLLPWLIPSESKRLSTATINESKFICCIVEAPQLQQPYPTEQIVGEGS